METRDRKIELFGGSVTSNESIVDKGGFTISERKDELGISHLSTRGITRNEFCSNVIIVR